MHRRVRLTPIIYHYRSVVGLMPHDGSALVLEGSPAMCAMRIVKILPMRTRTDQSAAARRTLVRASMTAVQPLRDYMTARQPIQPLRDYDALLES